MTDNRSGAILALVITCIDFRLIDDAEKYLRGINYINNYDEFILAGASLGYNTNCNKIKPMSTTPESTKWTELLDDHILISDKLHHIREIIVIDHMDCGAYKYQLNNGLSTLPDGSTYSDSYPEIKAHVEQLNTFRKTINEKYLQEISTFGIKMKIPKYTVKLLLMKLNGDVDINPTYWRPNRVLYLNKNSKIKIEESISDVISTIPKGDRVYNLYPVNVTENNEQFAKVYKGNDGEWYLENLVTGIELIGQTNQDNNFSRSFYLKLEKSLAYIEVRMDYVWASPSWWLMGIADNVKFTFKSVDYFKNT